jgi:hypothetical protein
MMHQWKYGYKLDSYGNWVEQDAFDLLVPPRNNPVPTEIVYRTITYR